ncbi:DUF4105 domain-containing protein, partial [uncultured Muribaculum sp.]
MRIINKVSAAMAAMLLTAATFGDLQARNEVLPDDSISVSLITCLPGNQVYELEGHTALRIKRGDNDLAVNYGIFDFDSPNFIYRFVKGETDYMVAAYPFEYFMADYMRHGRRVVEQHLDLTQPQAHRLSELLSENLRPEKRTYRYNYVKDNCATRPLVMLEAAIGDTLSFTAPDHTA